MDLDGQLSDVLLRPRPRLLLVALITWVILGACTDTGSKSVPVSCPSADPLRGIYSPERLEVLGTCRWFSGAVIQAEHRDDGDLHLLMKPDAADTPLLNVENVNAGGMVVEIVPGQQLPAPSAGDHIAVFGTWVLDTHNGWNEIHPVWAIRFLDTGTTVQALPPVPPRYDGGGND